MNITHHDKHIEADIKLILGKITPATETHIDSVLSNYFKGKGVKYEDGKIVI